jgi:hypothetical protein
METRREYSCGGIDRSRIALRRSDKSVDRTALWKYFNLHRMKVLEPVFR